MLSIIGKIPNPLYVDGKYNILVKHIIYNILIYI